MFKKEIINNYKDLLKNCFSTDEQLIQVWHLEAGKGLESCVEKTFQDLQLYKTQIFKLSNENELAGYFGKEVFNNNTFLTGFFLLPKFRNHEGRTNFWNSVESELTKPYFCGLYEKNVPANKFIKSHGGHLIKSVDLQDGLAFVYRIGN